MITKQYLSAVAAGALLTVSLGAGALTFAQTTDTTGAAAVQGAAPAIRDCGANRGPGGFGMGRGIHGTVASISGSTLTVTATNPKDNTTSTYTVDASSATVLKGDSTAKPATSTLSAVAVGDTVMVAGEVSGTSIVASMIADGPMMRRAAK